MLVFLLCTATDGACGETAIERLSADSGRARYFALERTYYNLTPDQQRQPEALYLAAFAWMRLNKPALAKPLLQAAIDGGFNGYPGWKSAKAMLTDIATIEKLAPPHYADLFHKNQVKLQVYAKRTQWSTPILSRLPSYIERAAQVFGDDIPKLNYYIFDNRVDYNQFFKTMFLNVPRSGQDGTGGANIVLFCEQDENGKLVLPVNRAIGNNLHEYGHALCNTIFGDNYLDVVPQWFDEGMADAVARPYYDDLFAFTDRHLSDLLKNGRTPPTYKQMSKELYNDSETRYCYARMMMQELLKGRSISVLRNIVDEAHERQNFDEAIVQVAGVNPPNLLQLVIDRYRRR